MNELIITAELNYMDQLLEMASDLWKDDYSEPELRSFFHEAMNSDKYKILLSLNDNKPEAFIFFIFLILFPHQV